MNVNGTIEFDQISADELTRHANKELLVKQYRAGKIDGAQLASGLRGLALDENGANMHIGLTKGAYVLAGKLGL